MAKTYNPYNAVKSISDLKGKYHTAKELGGDYKQYQRQAEQYYEELMNNGMTDLANELTANDYIGSLDILARYKPDREVEMDDLYESMAGVTPYEPVDTASRANDILGSLSQPFSDRGVTTTADDILGSLYDDAWQEKYGAAMDQALGIATGAIKPETSDAVQGILDSFANTDALLNGDLRYDTNGNAIGGLNIDHYNTGKNQLDFINNFDYTEQSYFDPIMQSYQLKGSDAAKGQLAGGASGNSGNIDSYAAANANRQQLAFTNAGHEAARAAAQQNFGNWQQLYDAMSGNLQSMGAINAQNLATGANMYATDSAERQAALAGAVGLADSEAQRRIDAYLAKLTDDTTRYGIDADMQAAREALAFNTADSEANRALDRYLQEMADARGRYEIDTNAAIQRESLELQKYGIDAETANAIAIQELANKGAIDLANINNAAELEAIAKQYGFEKELAGINNAAAMDQLNAQIAAQDNSKQITALLESLGYTVDDSGNITEAVVEYTPDEIARNVIAGIEDGTLTDIKSYDDFARFLTQNGVPAKDANELRKEWEALYPYLFDSIIQNEAEKQRAAVANANNLLAQIGANAVNKVNHLK